MSNKENLPKDLYSLWKKGRVGDFILLAHHKIVQAVGDDWRPTPYGTPNTSFIVDGDRNITVAGPDAPIDARFCNSVAVLLRPPNLAGNLKSKLVPFPDAWLVDEYEEIHDSEADGYTGVSSFGISLAPFRRASRAPYRVLEFTNVNPDRTGDRDWIRQLRSYAVNARFNDLTIRSYVQDCVIRDGGYYHPDHQEPVIKDWKFKCSRGPIEGTTEKRRTFGVEVECSFHGGHRPAPTNEFWKPVDRLFKEYGHIMFDGSLSGAQAAEIVTRPANLEAMTTEVVPRIAEAVAQIDYGQNSPYKNHHLAGVHVHCGRRQISDYTIYKMDYMVTHPNNWPFLEKVAGRTQAEYCAPTMKTPKERHADARGMNVGDHVDSWRRRQLNLSNEPTIEFRIWVSPFGHGQKEFVNSINAAVEFTDAMVSWAMETSLSRCAKWREFSWFVFRRDNGGRWPALQDRLSGLGLKVADRREIN